MTTTLGDRCWQVAEAAPVPGRGAPVDPTDDVRLLVVEAAGHRCGLAVAAVVEIHAAVRLAGLPDAPEVVVGLVNRRGSPMPVLSLRHRLGLAPREVRLDDHLVVVQLADRQVGLLTDAAVEVLSVPAADVDALATTGAAYSSGVAVLPDGLLVVVDLSAFLSAAEAVALDQCLAEVTA